MNEVLNKSEIPDISNIQDESGVPEKSDIQDESGVPEKSDIQDESGVPEKSKTLKRDRLLKGVEVDGINYLHVSIKKMFNLTSELIKQIKKSKGGIDRIIFLATGGSDIAKWVKDGLGVGEYSMIRLQSYNEFESGDVNITEDLPELTKGKIKGKIVLLVDDLADSGKTFEFAKKYLEGLGAGEVKTAALYLKPRSIFKPDFYVASTKSWIVSAHEYNEFIGDFYKQQSLKGFSYREIKRDLRKIGLPRKAIREYMPLVSRRGLVV